MLKDTDKNLDFELARLEKIYDMQHYFIDRHEVMAGKIMTSLMIIVGAVSILLSFVSKSQLNPHIIYIILFIAILFFISFWISFYLVVQTIRPLSSKAIKEIDEKLLPKTGKKWVKESLIYHRGIVKFINICLKNKENPIEKYLEIINKKENIMEDYTKQIFILAYYSDYKRQQLEKATMFTICTSVMGVSLLIIYIFPI